MVRIDIGYLGDLRCEARHGPSGATLYTDAPLDNHGRGASFSPTDLLATALGTCMLTIMGIAARAHGIDLSGASVSVEKEMLVEPERRIGRLRVSIHVPGETSTEQRRLLEAAARACPVHKSLLPEVETPLVFRWGESD